MRIRNRMVTWTEPPSSSTIAAPIPSAPAQAAPDADAAVTLELCGYDAENSAFLLSVFAAATIGAKRTRPESYLRREFVDFQTWDRHLSRVQQHGQPFERLPTRRARKLMEQSWLKNDASSGWRLELQKNVAACEKWVNDAFQLLPEDQQRVFLHNEQYQQYKQERADARVDAQHAKALQQYFTSQPLVDLTLERVAAFLKTKRGGELAFASDQILWLEPSCGDGRFVSSLLDAGAQHVVGIELDETLCREARAAVEEHAQEQRVEIRQGDFLASQRAVAGEECPDASQLVVTIGNPPFGDKADAIPSADLIQRFFQHAAGEWRAELIAFIVPERCARPAYTQVTLATLHAATSHGDVNSNNEWQLAVSEPLDGFYFEFRSTKRIKQPSVLLIYHRLREHS
ncbi:hypothetical protein Gpo141_00012127 [Globisporangium polare]